MSIIKSGIGGAALILLGLFFVVLAWGGHFKSIRVMHEGGRSIARVTDKKIERSRPGAPLSDPSVTIDHNIYYTFKTKDGKNIDGRYSIRKPTWDNIKIGSSIEVAYAFDNSDYNFPVGEGSMVPAEMPIALSVFGVMAVAAGAFLVIRGRRLSQREPMLVSGSPEDKRVLRLLEKMKAESLSSSFGSHHPYIVFSNGHFLEFADSLPAAIDALHDLFSNRLSEDSIKQVLSAVPDQRAEKVHAERKLSGKYHLSTPRHTGLVDAVYYDYLKMRYPRAEVFCDGPAKPFTFYQDGILRAVVMPLKG